MIIKLCQKLQNILIIKSTNKAKFILVISYLIILNSNQASATDIGGSMAKFWNDMGGSTNITKSGAYQGQSAGYYTLGNIHARTPIKNVNVANLQLPSVSAGCGGIDLFKGSFSFINSEQIIELLKAIANNAKGFAFQLALETISPVIAEKVEELQALIQQINSAMVNSCETAASLVGSVWPQHDKASNTICSTIGNKKGLFDDYAHAKHGCTNKGERGKVNREDATDEYDNVKVEDINLAWKALKDSKILQTNGKFDKEMAELFMALSGTVIIKSKGKDANGNEIDAPEFVYISAKADNNEIITAMLDGGEVSVHICDEAEKCLNPALNGSKQTIDEKSAYKEKVSNIISSMTTKIMTDVALDTQELGILNFTTIPLYKMLNVYAAYSGSISLFELPTYAEIIALDMIYVYLDNIVKNVEQASNRLAVGSPEELEKFKNNLRETRKSLASRELKTNNRVDTIINLVERTTTIEGMLSNRLGSSMSNAIKTSRVN
jgi:conjugative transfer pilus assembly protein TraH